MDRLREILSASLLLFGLFLLAVVGAGRAAAADLTFRPPPREGYVGVPSILRVDVRNGGKLDAPAFPEVEGLRFELGQSRHRQSTISIVNGTRRETFSESLEIEITPSREGTFAVPAIGIVLDGKEYRSSPFTLVAKRSDATGILFVELTADPPNPYVGQPTRLQLQIYFKPYRDPTANISLDGGNMWSLLDTDGSDLGPFRSELTRLEQRRQRPADRQRVREDTTYFVYQLEDVWTPTQVGTPDFGALVVRGEWPTGIRTEQDPFGQVSAQLTGTRPLAAVAEVKGISVRPLPEADRPASFSGAVGDFTVSATARPTEIAVGAPITITYSVASADRDPRSIGALDTLQAPPFANLPKLTKSFRIPSEQLGGTVQDRQKTFTQTFRPLSADVTEIPPLPFSFFDPEAGTYREVFTEPIPITVRASERVSSAEIIGNVGESGDADRGALTTVAGGLVANAPPSAALLASSRVPIGWGVAGVIAFPPALCSVLFIMRRVQERRDANPLRTRALRAHAQAQRVLLSTASSGSDAEAVLRAVTGYIADRCGLPEGEKTRGDAAKALADAGVDADVARRVDELLAACERSRYAPSAAGGPSRAEAKAILERLEHSRLGLRAEGVRR